MQKSFAVTAPIEAEISLALGAVVVEAAPAGPVEVELTARDEGSQQLVDAARVELAGGRLTVEVPPRRRALAFALVHGHGGIDCRIRCPAGSSIAARTKAADLTARGTFGSLSLATASGDLRADRATGAVTVQSASGDVDLERVDGPLSVQTVSGDVTAVDAGGDVTVNTVSGDVRVAAVRAGRVTANGVSGDVTVGVHPGRTVRLDCVTAAGDTSSDLDALDDAPAGDAPVVEIRVKTVSGDIRIVRAPQVEEAVA